MLYSVSWFSISYFSWAILKFSSSVSFDVCCLSVSVLFLWIFRFSCSSLLSFSSICCWASNSWCFSYLTLASFERILSLFSSISRLSCWFMFLLVLFSLISSCFSLFKTWIWCSNCKILLLVSSSVVSIAIISDFFVDSSLSISSFWFFIVLELSWAWFIRNYLTSNSELSLICCSSLSFSSSLCFLISLFSCSSLLRWSSLLFYSCSTEFWNSWWTLAFSALTTSTSSKSFLYLIWTSSSLNAVLVNSTLAFSYLADSSLLMCCWCLRSLSLRMFSLLSSSIFSWRY